MLPFQAISVKREVKKVQEDMMKVVMKKEKDRIIGRTQGWGIILQVVIG